MTEQEFKNRTKQFGVRVMMLIDTLPNKRSADMIGKQLLRSATSIGAKYRAACRAESTADMIHNLKIVEEEADESIYWLEVLIAANLITADRVNNLIKEGNEILAMTVASIKTLRNKKKN